VLICKAGKALHLFATLIPLTSILIHLRGERDENVCDVQHSKLVVTNLKDEKAATNFRVQNSKCSTFLLKCW
jgi:hypothetical protein